MFFYVYTKKKSCRQNTTWLFTEEHRQDSEGVRWKQRCVKQSILGSYNHWFVEAVLNKVVTNFEHHFACPKELALCCIMLWRSLNIVWWAQINWYANFFKT